MKIFLDTAVVDEIKEAASSGMIDGVTTNPTLIKRSGRDFKEVINEIAKLVPSGAISAEVLSEDTEGMLKEAREYAAWRKNIVIKIPMTAAGICAVKTLSKEKIKTNVTLVFDANQALLAAKAGATYVSPFVGRLDDIKEDGMQVVREILQVFRNYDFKTEVIVASVRHPAHVRQAALLGAHIATIPYPVFRELFQHPLTTTGIEKFLTDAGRK